jgi:hypothetical protein
MCQKIKASTGASYVHTGVILNMFLVFNNNNNNFIQNIFPDRTDLGIQEYKRNEVWEKKEESRRRNDGSYQFEQIVHKSHISAVNYKYHHKRGILLTLKQI